MSKDKKRVIVLPVEVFFNFDVLAHKVSRAVQAVITPESIRDGKRFRSIYPGTRRAMVKHVTRSLLIDTHRTKVISTLAFSEDVVILSYSCSRSIALKLADFLDIDYTELVAQENVSAKLEKYNGLIMYNFSKNDNVNLIIKLLSLKAEKTDTLKEVTDDLIVHSLSVGKVSKDSSGKTDTVEDSGSSRTKTRKKTRRSSRKSKGEFKTGLGTEKRPVSEGSSEGSSEASVETFVETIDKSEEE